MGIELTQGREGASLAIQRGYDPVLGARPAASHHPARDRGHSL
jgi:hypothetical protein